MALDKFVLRHNGPREQEIDGMLKAIGASSLEELINQTIPASNRLEKPLGLGAPLGEKGVLN